MDNTRQPDEPLWIDTGSSVLYLQETASGCAESAIGRRRSLHWSSVGGLRSYSDFGDTLDTCTTGQTWHLRGHLRWNASSPYSETEPWMISDSIDAVSEPSTTPLFDRGTCTAPLELRWSDLAWTDSSSRCDMSRYTSLESIALDWESLQKKRGLATALDTAQLRSYLAGFCGEGVTITLQTRFPCGDSLWSAVDHPSWVRADLSGTESTDLFKAAALRTPDSSSLIRTPLRLWS